ncbi:MAG: acetyl-CoA carboxylase carboxyltransferase subunit alpha [Alphaproteobacteria bacterium]|nr:acetyl-CoA carboxylase carboxyltransferase subunit alpha [Alphaproteobacteria bacterium]
MKYLEFEKEIQELEQKRDLLRHEGVGNRENLAKELSRIESKLKRKTEEIYKSLNPWQKTLVARHETRPHTLDYIEALIDDFTPLAGDRLFAEDAAMVSGLGRFRGHSVVVLGLEKGNSTQTRLEHNFGMSKPEGYRKAVRMMELANHFNLPVLTFIDTAGAYPGVDAEARGQAEAIAKAMEKSFNISVPLIACVIGEGGSGGAIALAVADKVLMLENSIYSVISPEGCASILWRDASMAKEASKALHLTAQDLLKLKVIDEIIPEPLGGAHRNPAEAMKNAGDVFEKHLKELDKIDTQQLKGKRRDKFLQMTRDVSLKK